MTTPRPQFEKLILTHDVMEDKYVIETVEMFEDGTSVHRTTDPLDQDRVFSATGFWILNGLLPRMLKTHPVPDPANEQIGHA